MDGTTSHAHDETAWLQLARRLQEQQPQQLSQLGELTSQFSVLVHMLQRGHGASNIFLYSGSQLYAAEYRAGEALVDERLALFYASLEWVYTVAGSAPCWRIARAVSDLLQLPALCEQIACRQITAEAMTEQFSRVIRYLPNIVPQPNGGIDDSPVAGRMIVLYSFMQGKELVGQERALSTLGFTCGKFSDSLRQQLVDHIDGQQPCFDSSQALDSLATVQLSVIQCQAGLDIEQLRRIARIHQPAADGEETMLCWFGLQTQRPEHLHEAEEQLIGDLLDVTNVLLVDDASDWLAGEEVDTLTPHLDKQLLSLVRQQVYELQQFPNQLTSLKDALEERKLAEKAKSLLITRQGMQEEQAWQTLCRVAMDKNQCMVGIARVLSMMKATWPLAPKEQMHNQWAFSACRRYTFT